MIKLTLPVYYTQEFKTKKSKTFLVGMNWYRNAFFHAQNTVKQHYHSLITNQLPSDKTYSEYQVTYTYYYKSKVSDLMNVVSLQSKFLNDALQSAGIVINDNVQYCKREIAVVGSQDKLNPRTEITIEEYTCANSS